MRVCRLLSIGYDPILMPVRSMLLHQAGHEVVEARSLGEALKRIKAGNFDLLLICHTVDENERDLIIEALRLSSPMIPILCLTTTPEYSDLNCSAASSTAPEFLAAVDHALHKPPGKRAS